MVHKDQFPRQKGQCYQQLIYELLTGLTTLNDPKAATVPPTHKYGYFETSFDGKTITPFCANPILII